MTSAPGTSRPYDELKTAPDGTKYRGARIGHVHRWRYQGIWCERKETPDRWSIRFRARKTRLQPCPPGAGVPLGTEYTWIIVAVQRARRTTWDDYETLLEGQKFLAAYQKPGWSLPRTRPSVRANLRVRMLAAFDEVLEGLGIAPTSNEMPGRACPLCRGTQFRFDGPTQQMVLCRHE